MNFNDVLLLVEMWFILLVILNFLIVVVELLLLIIEYVFFVFVNVCFIVFVFFVNGVILNIFIGLFYIISLEFLIIFV